MLIKVTFPVLSRRQRKPRAWLLTMMKRLIVWAGETILEALLLGLALIALFGYDQHEFARSFLLYVTGILLLSCTTGYLFTTALARTIWKGKKTWPYSVIASLLYLLHSALFFHIS